MLGIRFLTRHRATHNGAGMLTARPYTERSTITMHSDGLPRASHRYELRTTNDEAVCRTYRSLASIDAFARQYAAGTLHFDAPERAAGRGRYMERPLVLYKVRSNGRLIAYRRYEPDGAGSVKVSDVTVQTDTQRDAEKRKPQAAKPAAAPASAQ